MYNTKQACINLLVVFPLYLVFAIAADALKLSLYNNPNSALVNASGDSSSSF